MFRLVTFPNLGEVASGRIHFVGIHSKRPSCHQSDMMEGDICVGCTGPSPMLGSYCGHVVGGACPWLVACDVLPPVFAVETLFCWSSGKSQQELLCR